MRSYDLVVRGDLVTEQEVVSDLQIAVKGGAIALICDGKEHLAADTVIDARGKLIFPGIIDAHVHCNSYCGEGVSNATAAALAGGSTTVIDMPFDADGVVSSTEVLRRKIDTVNREALVDVALLGTLPRTGELAQVEGLVEGGICGMKLSVTESDPVRFPRINDGILYEALPLLARYGLPVGFHAENDEIIRRTTAAAKEDHRRTAGEHCRTRPPLTEYLEVAKLLEFALYSKVPLHLNHLTLPHSLEMASAYKNRGVDLTLETCPHYLLLDERDVERLGMTSKVNPPLRAPAQSEALWKHVLAGEVDIWASDHSPWPLSRKSSGDVFANASGMPGAETFLPLMFSEAVVRRGASPSLLVRHMVKNPARRYGLGARKGRVLPGADADFAILDPYACWTIHASELFSAADWNPYEGRTVRGRVTGTISRGRLAYDGRDILAGPGDGRFVPGAPQRVGKKNFQGPACQGR